MAVVGGWAAVGEELVSEVSQNSGISHPSGPVLWVQTNWLNLKVPRLRWKSGLSVRVGGPGKQAGAGWGMGAVVFLPLQSPGNTVSSSLLLSPPLPSFPFAPFPSFLRREGGTRLK